MPTVDENLARDTLDSLRNVRRKLFSIPESELSAMGLEDQTAYGDNLHQNSLAIMKLEKAKLQGVNKEFKEKETELKSAAGSLEADTAQLEDAVKMVRVASDGIKLVTNIIKLLA
jgi:hypothetical protein